MKTRSKLTHRFPAVHVTWVDSCGPSRIWHDPDFENYECSSIESIGWLVAENRRRIVIAQAAGLSDTHDEVAQVMAIPKGCIKRMQKLRMPNRNK